MERGGKFGLNYPEDFKVACAVHYFRQEEVLQYFINRVSFYAFNGGEMEAVALFATNIILKCKLECSAEILPVQDKRVERTVIKYIRLLSNLSDRSGLPLVDKMEQSFRLMQEWEAAMSPLVNYPERMYLDDDHFLSLTFDFSLLCHMNGVGVNQILQYFIDHISLPVQRAGGAAEAGNPVMSLFSIMLMNRAMNPIKQPNQQNVQNFYLHQLYELDMRMIDESDSISKQQAYRKLYAEWYDSLNQNIN